MKLLPTHPALQLKKIPRSISSKGVWSIKCVYTIETGRISGKLKEDRSDTILYTKIRIRAKKCGDSLMI